MSYESEFLAGASAVGRRLVREAVWYGGRCTWMGATPDPKQRWRLKYRALGPRAYEGTAGVGMFLARLALVTGDASVRATAVGALRHALDRTPSVPPSQRDGLYAGVIGVALAGARVAAWLDEPELDAGARALAAEPALPDGPGRCPDVIMGSAGVIIGVLALAEGWSDAHLVARAVGTGHAVLRQARVTQHGYAWASRGRSVCGLAHGAGGIGWALLELFAATGDERFRAAAREAFAYERSWLDTVSGTWPDLRIPGQRRGRPPIAGASITGTWCRGEAGIAKTRLRSALVTGSKAEGRDADVALDTTRRHVSALLVREIEDLSLCHGAAGAAEVLLSAGEPASGAIAVGRRALERHVDGRQPWPCGVPGGTTPGLFLGFSGIGWWLLRLHDSRIPSPLGTWA
jgi:class II lanthipeptide synthase